MNRRSFIAWISSLCVVLPWKSKEIPAGTGIRSCTCPPSTSWKVITTSLNRHGLTEIKTIGSVKMSATYNKTVRSIKPTLPPGFVRDLQRWHYDGVGTVNFEIIDREIPS